MSNSDLTTDEIRWRMHALRQNISSQREIIASELVKLNNNVRQAVDVKYQLKKRPWIWATMGLGIVVFWFSRRKQKVPNEILAQLDKLAQGLKLDKHFSSQFSPKQSKSKWLMGLLGSSATKYAIGFVRRSLTTYFMSKMLEANAKKTSRKPEPKPDNEFESELVNGTSYKVPSL